MSLFPCRKKKRGPVPNKVILYALLQLEKKMTQSFDNLKSVVASAVTTIEEAIAKIGVMGDDPVAIQAEADKLAAAVDALKSALANPPAPPVVISAGERAARAAQSARDNPHTPANMPKK